MELMINAWICLLLCSLTGSIFFLSWVATRLVFEHYGAVEELYRLLWITVLAFLIPVAYGILWIRTADGGLTLALPFLFFGRMEDALHWVLPVWAAGAVVLLLRHLLLVRRVRRALCGGQPADLRQRTVFDETCRLLGIREGSVALRVSSGTRVPLLCGLRHPAVILPEGKLSEEELRMVLLHELGHYCQKDLWLKRILTVVCILHWYNPLIWCLTVAVFRWCEYSCDFTCCRALNRMGDYFLVLLNHAEQRGNRHPFLYSQFFENKSELRRRVEKMKKCIKMAKQSRGRVAALFLALLLCTGMTTAVLAGELQERYDQLYENSSGEMEEAAEDGELVEQIDMDIDADLSIEVGEVQVSADGSIHTFNWTVKADTRKTTASFSVKKNQKIIAAVTASPSSKTIRLGIIRPDGSRSYVSGSGSLSHTFTASTAGTYRVYIQNDNATSVTVSGSYYVE